MCLTRSDLAIYEVSNCHSRMYSYIYMRVHHPRTEAYSLHYFNRSMGAR